MMQLFLHMLGDYLIQTDWMAFTKTKNTLKGYLACFIHALTYSLPFLFIGSIQAVLIIFVTHFLIDKYRLAKYFIQLKNWKFYDNGFSKETPAYISVWLLFITDNLFHIIINYLSILYF